VIRALLFCVVLGGPWEPASAAIRPGLAGAPAKDLPEQVEPLLGTSDEWKPALFRDLRRGMTCDEVRPVWKVEACDPAKESDIQPASGRPLPPPVHHVELQFKQGRLLAASIEFDPALDATSGRPLIALAEKKWGQLSAEDRAKTVFMWTNADSEWVYLTFIYGHWQLYSTFPTYDSGPVDAALVDETLVRARLAELLGDQGSWRAAVFGGLQSGMGCGQVRALFPTLESCDPASAFEPVAAPLRGDRVVAGYQFNFEKGGVVSATIILHQRLPKDLVMRVSLDAFERKWGRVDPRERAEETITAAHPETFETVQRQFFRRWTLEQQLRRPR